jgi:hypothetical protein
MTSKQTNQGPILLRILTVIFLALSAAIAHAEQLVHVYRGEQLVRSQSVAERNAATRLGMAEVILRVSGDKAALQHPGVRQALNQSQSYLYEFSYASTDEMLEEDGKRVPAVRLLLTFSQRAIEKLLRESQLSLWPANRPKLLVWQALRDESDVIQRVPDEAATKALYKQAAIRGVPLLLPAQDLEDTLALSSEDLWNADPQAIKTGSERYRPDATLVGRYQPKGDGTWSGSWQLFHSSGDRTFETEGADIASLFVQAVDASADYFARLYAIVPGNEEPGTVIMRIENVRDFAAYKNAERYLQNLAIVSQVELIVAESHQLLVRLHTVSDINLLLSTLELGKKFYPVASSSVAVVNIAAPAGDSNGYGDMGAGTIQAAAQGTLDNPLVYRWQP